MTVEEEKVQTVTEETNEVVEAQVTEDEQVKRNANVVASKKHKELTKRNANFVYEVKKLLTEQNKLSEEEIDNQIKEITHRLLTEQRKGITAKQIFGSPQKYLVDMDAPKPDNRMLHDFAYSTLALDSTYLMMILFTITAFIFTLMSNKNVNEPGMQGYGITFLVTVSVLGGFLYTWCLMQFTPRPGQQDKHTKGIKFLGIFGAMILWMAAVFGISLLPSMLNPVMPAATYLVIAVLAYVLLQFNRKKNDLSGLGLWPLSVLAERTRRYNRENQ